MFKGSATFENNNSLKSQHFPFILMVPMYKKGGKGGR